MKHLQEILLDKQVDSLLDREKGYLFEKMPVLQSLTVELPGTKNLWKHTLCVCARVAPTATLRWSALFHDVGKPVVYKSHKPKIGGVFPNHAMVGAEIWRENRARFHEILSASEIGTVERLIRYHMQTLSYTPQWNDKAVRNLASIYKGDIMLGIALAEADGGSHESLSHLAGRIENGGSDDERR